ncbi:MAG TPA: RNB domain-containing ribonuclease [Pyrinomonadaceae bacterium]|nr:RNB domain-containing ribonuclease [Pyrinomonadaceae bacterium]
MPNKSKHINLSAIADKAMVENGFDPTFPDFQIPNGPVTDSSVRDLRNLLWSSIDDGKTRDLDQVEFAESLPNGDVRLMIGIADVDAFVPKESPIDEYAATNCISVYTGVKTYPMLPEEFSTDLTSLVQGKDRLAVVTEITITTDGSAKSANFYRALVQNKAKLSYEEIGAWLEEKSGPPKAVQSVPGLEDQIRLQAEVAERLIEFRIKLGAIDLGTIQSVPVTDEKGRVTELKVIEPNAARELISNFMIAANIEMAEFLEAQGGPSLRRTVRTPKYWDRIVELAEEVGEKLSPTPDSRALADFLARRKKADPLHFPDLSLAVVKSLGPGEYAVQAAGEESEGHFGLAVQDYTHSTAPNRRFADLVTQRLVKSALGRTGIPARQPAPSGNNSPKDSSVTQPYTLDELKKIAARCTNRDSAARKVERKVRKVAAALMLRDNIGDVFDAIVTGVSEKGTFARVLRPPVDGRIMKGERGLRVGDKTRVRLISTDPLKGFIDFERVSAKR